MRGFLGKLKEVKVLIALIGILAISLSVTGTIQGIQASPVPAYYPGTLLLAASGGSVPIQNDNRISPASVVTPSPIPAAARNTTALPVGPVNVSLTFNPNDGFYTGSQLLYVATDRNITVIEADTNKVVDVIYLNKYEPQGIAVSPDYTKLYVLYLAHPDPNLVSPGYDDSYCVFLATVDLYTKQIVADTYYLNDYHYLVYGSPGNLVISPDGRYLYFASNTYDSGMILQYDTVLKTYTRGIETRKLYNPEGYFSSNARDLTIGKDGKRLYFADTLMNSLAVLNLPDLSLNGFFYTIDIDLEPAYLAFNDQESQLFLSGYIGGEAGWGIMSIDRAAYDPVEKTGELTWEFSGPVDRIRVGPDQQRLFVVEPSEKRVLAYDVSKPWEYATYFVDGRPVDFQFNTDCTELYTWCPGKSKIFVQDLKTRLQAPGSPIVVGPDDNNAEFRNGDYLVKGPVPQTDIFVNNSAYRNHQLQALPNLATTIVTVRYEGSLLSNKSAKTGGSSFYLDPDTGKTIFYSLSGIATATPTPKPAGISPLPRVTVIPFSLPEVDTGPQENQSQQNTSTASLTPGSAGASPGPATDAKPAPGFEAAICLAGLAIVVLAAGRKVR
jgi:hypothetical protein